MRQRASDSGRDDAAETHRRLIEVATAVFAERGFSEARVREIASRANVNVAMIGYHFQNKEGLYGAVISDIGTKMTGPLTDALDAARLALKEGSSYGASWDAVVTDLLVSLYRTIIKEGSGDWSRIMLREQTDPSAFFDQLHAEVAAPFMSVLADVLQHRAEERSIVTDHGTHLVRAVMLMGQVLVFTSAKTSIERMLSAGDMAQIEAILKA